MEPSTIVLLGLICLALLVYLPKLRNTVLWILFPPVMMLVRYPRTRKPAAVVVVLVGAAIFARHEYKHRHDWYCNRWWTKDGTRVAGRTGTSALDCYVGEDACNKAYENDVLKNPQSHSTNSWDPQCSLSYDTIWSYDWVLDISFDGKTRDKLPFTEQFSNLEDCNSARADVLKQATSECEDARKRIDRSAWSVVHN